jgi:hypothetical protein
VYACVKKFIYIKYYNTFIYYDLGITNILLPSWASRTSKVEEDLKNFAFIRFEIVNEKSNFF